MRRLLEVTLVLAALSAYGVSAQEAEPTPIWTGEASFSASATTGNSETTDLGAALKLKNASGLWVNRLQLSFDYGETTGAETKNRFFADYQLDRTLSDRAFWYGKANYELDQFDGFDYRAFLGGGAGYTAIATEQTEWALEGGPGLQLGEIGGTGETFEDFAVRFGSRYTHQLNDHVSLSNVSDAIWTDANTRLTNQFAITADLFGDLAARLGFDVSHDTDPPFGAEATDTATRLSLVYGFGGN